MNLVFDIVTWIFLLSLVLVIVRLLRGPSLPDRAVAADQIAIRGVAIIAIDAIVISGAGTRAFHRVA